jgi:hypothetical protein
MLQISAFSIAQSRLTIEYLTRKKHKNDVGVNLSRVDIDSVKIQKEEALTLLSGS